MKSNPTLYCEMVTATSPKGLVSSTMCEVTSSRATYWLSGSGVKKREAHKKWRIRADKRTANQLRFVLYLFSTYWLSGSETKLGNIKP